MAAPDTVVHSESSQTHTRVVNEHTALLGATENEHESVEEEQEAWNEPRANINRFIFVNYSFLIKGLNDACVGALIPYIQPYYDVGYTSVSTLFVVPFAGYLAAALLNNWVHLTFGQRGIAILGPVCRLIGYVPMALHPATFTILPIAMIFTGFGNGIDDSAWNAWVGNLRNANELLGLLHGSYGLGGMLSPLIASAMITKLHLDWYIFYYVMIAVSCLELVFGLSTFWTETGAAYRKRHKLDQGREAGNTYRVLGTAIPWLMSSFLFGYIGAEVCLGGWIPTYMIEVRHASGWLAGIAVTCFWGGLTLGRIILGFITGRIGEKLAITFYLSLCLVLEALYWKVPSIEVAFACIILLGFFLGPLFPAAIVVMTKILPPEQHVVTIGLTAAIGGSGAAVLPFAVGAVAEDQGVEVLQPFTLGILAVIMTIWLSIPGGLRKGGLEQARAEGAPIGAEVRQLVRWLKGSRE